METAEIRFDPGTVVMTKGIAGLDKEHHTELLECLSRHLIGDWGDLCDDDRQMNDESIEAEKNGEMCDRLMSVYETDFGTVWIITEWDRSATTILLPEEY